MFREEETIKIAKILKIFGLNGELTVRLYDAFPDELDYEEPLFVFRNGLLVPLFVKTFSRKGINKAVVVFDDIDTQYRATEFAGCDVVAFAEPEPEEELVREEGVVYMDDFIGYKFTDTISSRQGNIIDFIDSKFNPLFVVESEDEEFYIPANDEIITSYDADKEEIILSLPEGVFEINS